MEIEIRRQTFSDKSTIGLLAVDGVFFGYTLEDVCREDEPGTWEAKLKVPGATAIPYGRYRVAITWSSRFQRQMLQIVGVPDFEGVRIHSGLTAEHTEGCPLLGTSGGVDSIAGSKALCEKLQERVARALAMNEEVWISVVKGAETGDVPEQGKGAAA